MPLVWNSPEQWRRRYLNHTDVGLMHLKRTFLSLLTLLMMASLVVARPKPRYDFQIKDEILDGRQIVNVVDDLLEFWKQAKGQNLREARRLWLRTVETKHREYFDRAVYRDAAPDVRRAMLDEFLLRLPGRIQTIKRFNESIEDRLIDVIAAFKWRFPEYRQQRDIYIGLSLFRFDGSVRPVGSESGIPDTLCLGAEVLAGYSLEQLHIAIAHELFHLYHFGYLFRHQGTTSFSTAHLPLLAEGLAVAGTAAVYPGHPLTRYLYFSANELEAQEADLNRSAVRFLGLMVEGAPPAKYEPWFTSTSDATIPSRGGYLLGYEVVKRMLSAYSFEELVRMGPAQMREHAEEQLSAIATERVLLMVGAEAPR